jgi:hypothetical protein
MMFQIHKVTISRTKEDEPIQSYSYLTDMLVQDIKQERKRLKEQFQADRVFFVFTQIPQESAK